MDLRRYELATFAAAQRLRSSYCSLAHGMILVERFDEPVVSIATDRASSGLDEVDLAVMAFAEKIVDDTGTIGEKDLQRLRDLGLSDKDILDVVLAATVRCFFAKTLDALCTLPDASYAELPDELRAVLVVGRPIAD
jgi:alkylhydroperoxidase family enzyme